MLKVMAPPTQGSSGYSPVVRHGSRVRVELAVDHPGYADAAYRARRDDIAGQSADWCPGAAVPVIAYSEDQHGVWRTVCRELASKHGRYAASEVLEAGAAPAVPPHPDPPPSGATPPPPPSTRFR